MEVAIRPWRLSLARLEGALPFIGPALAEAWAAASLRRIWHCHVRDFPFDNIGLEHDPGLEAHELTRTWHGRERGELLSWVARRGAPPLARAARLMLDAKGADERLSSRLAPADRALDRLDALLPGRDPATTLERWIVQLREDESDFLEGGSEVVSLAGHAFQRFAPRGHAWAASLTAAVRPQVFGLGAAPLALADLAPRRLFRSATEEPLPALIDRALAVSLGAAADDLARLHDALQLGERRLASLYASSQAPAAWVLISALGPLTRAELARALGVTARTASQAALALERAGLARPRDGDRALVPTGPDRTTLR